MLSTGFLIGACRSSINVGRSEIFVFREIEWFSPIGPVDFMFGVQNVAFAAVSPSGTSDAMTMVLTLPLPKSYKALSQPREPFFPPGGLLRAAAALQFLPVAVLAPEGLKTQRPCWFGGAGPECCNLYVDSSQKMFFFMEDVSSKFWSLLGRNQSVSTWLGTLVPFWYCRFLLEANMGCSVGCQAFDPHLHESSTPPELPASLAWHSQPSRRKQYLLVRLRSWGFLEFSPTSEAPASRVKPLEINGWSTKTF